MRSVAISIGVVGFLTFGAREQAETAREEATRIARPRASEEKREGRFIVEWK